MRAKYYSFLLGTPTVFGFKIWDVLGIGALWAIIDFFAHFFSSNSFLSLEIILPIAGGYFYYREKFKKGYLGYLLRREKFSRLEMNTKRGHEKN